jgi:ribonucleoside-triphosphate reductase (formate)
MKDTQSKNLQVLKRDGAVVDFCSDRLYKAVCEASKSTGYSEEDSALISVEVGDKVINKILNVAKKSVALPVEDIQDMVEVSLMSSRYKDIAKHYISYRHDRDKYRDENGKLYKSLQGFLTLSDDTYARENSNKQPEQIVTHRDLLAGIVSKQYAGTIIPKHIMKEHNLGRIHVHDTDYLISAGIHNCGVYNFEYLLKNGMKLGDVSIESPKSVGTAANIICQALCKISGSSYGGQSIHEFDNLLRPYVLRSLDKLKKKQKRFNLPDEFVEESLRKEVYDACQLVIYQVQTVSSPNGQASFFSMSLSLSTDPTCKMIKEEYLKCHMKGIGPFNETPIFPKVLYFVEDGVNLNEGDPNFDEFQLALQCSSKRMYPDYIMAPNNRKMTGGSKKLVTPMGCRSFVQKYEENGEEIVTGRFNVGVTTVNLTYCAADADGCKDSFFESLEKSCELAYEANMIRVERLAKEKAKVSPILWQYGALATLEPEDTLDKVIYGGKGTCSLGFGGLYEALELLGDTTKDFGIEIMQFLKSKTEEFTKRSNVAWSPYGTPLESTCLKFAKSIKSEFPEVGFDRNYVTNSFHLPVFADVDIVDKFDWESDFYLYASGGNVNNIELPVMQNNIKGLTDVVRAAYDRVNYLIVNQPVDECYECGFSGEFDAKKGGFECPICGNNNPDTASCIRRVSGYTHNALARPANVGKYEEQQNRTKHI